MPSLIPLAGEPRTFEVGARAVVGRDPTCEVCVEDPSVSRRHAEIRLLEDGRYEVVDLASKHGVVVRGEKVQKAVLAHGDELQIGLARFRFQSQDPALGSTELRISVADVPGFRPAALIASESELRRDYDKLRAGIELSRAIGVEHHLPTLLGRILDAAIPLLAADRGAIAILDPGTLEATLQIGRGRGGEDLDVPLSLSLLREVVAAKAGVISADAAVDGRFNGAASLCAEGIRSLMCVPMFYRGTLVGAMQLDSRGLGVFREKDLQLFSMITNQAAVAIHNALLVQKVNAVHAEHRARLERIVRGLPDGVLLLDAEGRLVMVNQRAEALLPVLTNTRQGDLLPRLGDVALPLKGTVEVTAGRRIFALSQVALDSQTLITLREVTEEREEQARAEQQERLALIGQFAGGIAHDFNNVIAVITTNAEFLEESIQDPDQREDARQIREAAERAADLTRRVLSFGRREPCQPRPLDLRKAVLDIEKILKRTLGAHIELSSDLQAAGSLVRADPTQLEQVLLNLAVNRHAARGGRAGLRAVLHHQAQGPRHRSRSRHRARHRQTVWRIDLAHLGDRRRNQLPPPLSRDRRATRRGGRQGASAQGRQRDHPRRRGRARRPAGHAEIPGAGRLSCPGSGLQARGAGRRQRPDREDRSLAHRPGDARRLRQGAERRAARAEVQPAGALHVRVLRRGARERAAQPLAGFPAQAIHARATSHAHAECPGERLTSI
ncbi:MAG: FHA domain-containing protein [Deltaproteobacteria bacterium]|nr:MAG: FHA domain-containing protein [Deltaproteobacteria bacterium]